MATIPSAERCDPQRKLPTPNYTSVYLTSSTIVGRNGHPRKTIVACYWRVYQQVKLRVIAILDLGLDWHPIESRVA